MQRAWYDPEYSAKYHRFMRRAMICTALLLAVYLPTLAQDGDGWQIKGFVDTYHALRTRSPYDWMSSRTRVRGEVERVWGNSTAFVSANLTYNTLLQARTGIQLREAYLDHRSEHWGLRAGRQLVIWGVADALRITDQVSPMDMTEFLAQDYDDIRQPVNALRLYAFTPIMKVEAVVVPLFEGYVLPVDRANPWSVLPTGTALPLRYAPEGCEPKFRMKNVEYGARLGFNLPGVDFSLTGLYTWNKQPVVAYELGLGELLVKPQYYRMGMVGADISVPWGQVVLRGEGAFNIGKHYSYTPFAPSVQKGFNAVNWMVGLDWYAPNEWTISGQFSMEDILNYEDCIAQKNHQMLGTLNVSKKLINSTLQLSDFTYYDITNRGWFSRFSVDYALSDQIHLSCGYDWLGGRKDEGIFGRYRKNSEVWVKARYSF